MNLPIGIISDKGVIHNAYPGKKLKVMDGYGVMRDAVVKQSFEDELYNVTLTNGDAVKHIIATKHRRWHLDNVLDKDNFCKTITDGIEGEALQRFKSISEFPTEVTDRECEAFAVGFVLGNYCNDRMSELDNGRARFLLNVNQIDYIPIFERAGFEQDMPGSMVSKGDEYTFWIDKGLAHHSLEEFVSLLGYEELKAMFCGIYVSTKDYESKEDRIMLCSKCEPSEDVGVTLLKVVLKISSLAGYFIKDFYLEKSSLEEWEYGVSYRYFVVNFITKQAKNDLWVVKSVQKMPLSGKQIPVLYVEEPFSHTLTLEGGIVVGDGG